jgi:hypothetical protein
MARFSKLVATHFGYCGSRALKDFRREILIDVERSEEGNRHLPTALKAPSTGSHMALRIVMIPDPLAGFGLHVHPQIAKRQWRRKRAFKFVIKGTLIPNFMPVMPQLMADLKRPLGFPSRSG